MKSKPIKHKTTNTFRFIPFAERINSIDIRHAALYHVEHVNTELPEENETHFHLAVRKWQGLNLTDNFKKFKQEVFGVITVPQLLHKKDDIVEVLERYLNLEDSLCLQPLLEILVSLAKDLRNDFYVYFPKFLNILIKLLDTKNAEQLEWTLICLAFLFKILKPSLKKDIAVVLKKIIPLLSENQPQYINNFAAESFAFVARDIRDKKNFINLILNYLKKNEDAITGCGHLIFEVIRGVGGKFHSCIETFLPILLQNLKENKDHQDILFQVLTQTIEDSLQVISHKEYEIFWNCVMKYIEEILKENKEDCKGLEYILRLAGQVIEYQRGKYLNNPPLFVVLLVKVICEQLSESVLDICAQIGAILLLTPNISLSQEHGGVLVKVILMIPYPSILLSFVENITDYSQFDMLVLPAFLKFVIQSNFEESAMSALTKICLKKSPLSMNGIKLFEWVKYPLNCGSALPLFMEYFDSAVSDDLENIVENPSKLMNALFCLPHVVNLNIDVCVEKLSTLIGKLLDNLTKYNLENGRTENIVHSDHSALSMCARKILFILTNAMESAIHISNCKKLDSICDINKFLPIILPCGANPNYLVALHLLDLYLTAYEHENGLKYTQLVLVDSFLKHNVSSPFHVIRLLTTHIYKLFGNIEELNKNAQVGANVEKLCVFDMCFDIESTNTSIQEYRSQLNMLQKMTFNTIQYTLIKSTDFQLFPLNYMLGVLYMNFKLLWEPVSEFIAGFGNTLPSEEFWPTFHKALEISFANAKSNSKQFVFDNEIETEYELLKKMYVNYCNITERPDFYNYRNLILKVMTNCIEVCEAKNRDVVVIFLKFIEEEYRIKDKTDALKIDVEVHDQTKTEAKIETELEHVEDTEEDIKYNIDIVEEVKDSASGKMVFKTLINVMQVLAHFKNPRALHKEPLFWEIYMNFLKNKNPGLQKYALDCILNYKNKSIMPYKENLQHLVDDKKFKDELTLFKITEDSNSIHQEDREHVVPIILRILYGKMTVKLGADKKGGGQTRRALIMRYLAGCNENELKMFIDMAFSHFKDYLTMEPKQILDHVLSNLDLKSITSPGKLHSILNLFDVVQEYFGGYMKDELLSYLFKVFYSVSSIVGGVLAQGDRVHIGYMKIMKNLRILALGTARKLYEQFVKYTWSKDELYIVFETLIFPLITKLHIEGIHNPTALLKLLNVWCQNPRYYIFLITCSDSDQSISAIPALFNLLLAPKVNPKVVNMILDMVEKLLTLIEDEEEKELQAIETFNKLQIKEKINADINFGSKILIPHIPNILQVMKRRIANSAKSKTVNKRDLLILSRVTELVSDAVICEELLNLLLPILVKKICMNMAEENMEYAVTSITNLLGHSSNPQNYIKNIAVLFNKVSPIEVRKLLIKLLNSIAENSSKNKDSLTRLANIVTEMNAFNERWIEQPDFDRRLDSYKRIYQLAENDEIDVDLAILIVNNCFYFVKTEKDIGLRESAGLCLKKILPKVLMKYRSTNDGQFLVRDTVLSLISTGIRDSKNEILRNESIALLGELVKECPDADVVFSDLVPLSNKEDSEVDFFENMCHLQMHRRVRALFKFCKVAKKMTKCPTPRTLTNFILPLASMHLCDDNYTDKNTLIDACIEVVSTCCRLLPWYHYEVILKLYLNKIRHTTDYQKQLTRILIGILDAFHFDFSKAKNIVLPKALTTNIEPNQTAKSDTLKDKNNKVDEDLDDEKMEVDDDQETKVDDDIESELKEADDAADEMEEMKEDLSANVPAFERVSIVSPSVAKRIIKSLTAGLLPQLNRAIGKLTEHEESHKVNRRRTGFERQEEDMLRVPIALALVKLLQRLPGDLLRHQLPGIIIKLCSFLKSPLKQVRTMARDIVKKIMVTVGTGYLGILLEHLTMLLTRGFQVHVLVATIHSVLDALKGDFKMGDLNECLDYILDVCTEDLFGALSDEKEVKKLHYKTPEAKPSKKSYVTLMLVAQNISEECLVNLILPIKEVLQKNHSKKTVLKVQEALTNIATGLVSNNFIKIESLFIFLHGLSSESIPQFVLGAPKREITEIQRKRMLIAKPDCFIIPETPKRNREVQAKNVKTSEKTSAHVLVEFSLSILYTVLKREKVSRVDCRAFVDPLVPLLVDALNSDHVKVATVALKCIATLWTNKIITPTLQETVKDIAKTIFIILHKYATFEISKQNDNFHLVRIAFKAVTVLIRHVNYYKLEEEQLKTLLLYAEEDFQSDERQANSFSLLKAILEARLVSPELHEVMEKVSTICILSESARSRDEARAIFLNYLTHYSLGVKTDKYIQFFVAQLNYEMQHGRESSLKFLDMIINKFQLSQLNKSSGFLLVSLGSCMVEDAAPECRAAAASCIEAMLARLDALQRSKLYDLVLTFFNDNKPVHFELAAQLSTRFVNVEKGEFKNRLNTVLSLVGGKLLLLGNDIAEGRFVKMKLNEDDDKSVEERQTDKDHCLIQLLNLTEAITVHCSASMTNDKYAAEYDEIAQQCQAYLAYPHAWVRLKAAKVLSQLLTAIKGDQLDAIVKNKVESDRGFIFYKTEEAIRSLVLDLCAQYTPNVTKEMADQVSAVLFQILNLVNSMSSFALTKVKIETIEEEAGGKLNIRWILFKLRKAINVEVVRAPTSMNIRTSIFTMWTHVISTFDVELLRSVMDVLLPPVVRELSVEDGLPSPAKHLAGRIGKKLRRRIGDIEYGKLVAEVQTRLNARRAERKKLLVQEKIHNPEKAAKRKLQLKEKKKQAKKIKLEMLHGKRPRAKKRKAEDFELEDTFLNDNED